MRAIAINVGANTNQPGFRAPVYADGTFEYVPIPESEPTRERVPTYGDLAPHLETEIPPSLADTPVHLDPEFATYPCCERYTYGDEHAVKAGPLSTLAAGDYLLFYATLTVAEPAPWLPPSWGAFLVGQFRLDSAPVEPPADVDPGGGWEVSDERFANNAHLKRKLPDARVLLSGDPAESRLFERARPLSASTAGTEPNDVVRELSADSGRGPWWRRPLRFDEAATGTLLEFVDDFSPGDGEYHR